MPERTQRRSREGSAPRLDQPREAHRRRLFLPGRDPDAFGRFAEGFARFMGTARFLLYMTVFIIVWILLNVVGLIHHWDKYPFILLNLIFSTQASYAAPLILLAQNRQADRDKVVIEQDRARDERGLADTEYLTREVAALRIALGDTATRDFVRSELRGLLDELDQRGVRLSTEPNADGQPTVRSSRRKGETQPIRTTPRTTSASTSAAAADQAPNSGRPTPA